MPTVLSTKKLSVSQKQLLLNAGIGFVEYNAIKVEFSTFDPEQITSSNYIFTSKNAVRSVFESLDSSKISKAKIFCVGEKTKELIEVSGYSVEATASYGADLGELLVRSYRNLDFTYFCGNIRMDELPDILTRNNIKLREIPVYVTTLNEQVFQQEFDGIMFYSPSGVESFCFRNNIKTAMAFCIGTTTASAAEKYTTHIKTATKPSIENLIVQVVKQYK